MATTTLVVVVAVAPATRTSDDESGGHTKWPQLESARHLAPGPALCGRMCWSGPTWPASRPPAHPGESPGTTCSKGQRSRSRPRPKPSARQPVQGQVICIPAYAGAAGA